MTIPGLPTNLIIHRGTGAAIGFLLDFEKNHHFYPLQTKFPKWFNLTHYRVFI
jgi:hypothetical protein